MLYVSIFLEKIIQFYILHMIYMISIRCILEGEGGGTEASAITIHNYGNMENIPVSMST